MPIARLITLGHMTTSVTQRPLLKGNYDIVAYLHSRRRELKGLLDDPKMDKFLHYILHGRNALPVTDNTIYTLQTFGQHINEEFDHTSQFSVPARSKETHGKLGGKNVVLDASTNVGIFFVEEDRLGVSSQANFSTVRANCCVYKGKWIYEVMLGSKGVMQLGWSTKSCHFSHEQGVGDTPDSYSYDGNRIRKWNVSTAKYGEAWKIGDTIGCAIDMDIGTISFYRNGKCMGEAFKSIKIGYGMAYFPTISLSINETVRLNFGSTPLLYPIEGYSPMQEPPTDDLVKTRIIFSALERLLDMLVRIDSQNKAQPEEEFKIGASRDNIGSKTAMDIDEKSTADYDPAELPTLEGMSQHALLFIIAGLFFEKLVKFLSNAYIVEKCVSKFLLKYISNDGMYGRSEHNELRHDRGMIVKFLDILWSYVDNALLKDVMENLVTSVLMHYRFSPLEKDLKAQKVHLAVLIAMLRHEPTRKFLIQYILFEKTKLPLLMHLKLPDAEFLEHFVPSPYIDVTTLLTPSPPNRTPHLDYSVARIMDPSIVAQHAQQLAQRTSALQAQRPYDAPPISASSSVSSSMTASGLNFASMSSGASSTITSRSVSPSLAHGPESSQNTPVGSSSISLSTALTSSSTGIVGVGETVRDARLVEVGMPRDASTASLRSGLYNDLGTGTSIDLSQRDPFDPAMSPEAEKSVETALHIFTAPETKEKYEESLHTLDTMLEGLEKLQQHVIKMLLNNKDSLRGCSSRYLFLKKFRNFLHENLGGSNTGQPFNKCSHQALLCLFHKLTQELRVEWDAYAQRSPHRAVPSSEAFMPCQYFYNDTINYFDLQRIAGIMSYLRKTHSSELSAELDNGTGVPASSTTSQASIKQPSSGALTSGSSSNASTTYSRSLVSVPTSTSSTSTLRQRSTDSFTLNPKVRPEASLTSLIELLDGVVLLYHIAGHNHTSKMAKVREILREYISTIKSTQLKIDNCPLDKPEIRAELERIKQVFTNNALEQARHLAWIKTFVFSKKNQNNVHWLLQTILRTIDKAVEKGGNLYLFVPEFYFETCLNAFYDLKINFSPTAPLSDIPDFATTLKQYVKFVTRFFRDTNVVSTELRDVIVQSLASLVCYPDSLAVLESGLEPKARHDLVAKLLTPYENWPWAQTNWILVRFWKGCGYGFDYLYPPHLKNNPKCALGALSFGATSGPAIDFLKLMPSKIYQAQIGEVLTEDQVKASATVNSILNQLNWAFSEFVGMLQEIQQASVRADVQVFIDSRQLKLCATCFDLTVGLLRCLEMITNVAPFIFTDFDRPSAEIFLTNIFQLTCQILTRVTSRKSAFNSVVSMAMPGLEMIHHYPILSAVAGIWVQLIMKTDPKSRQRALTTLIHEPGFQISALKSLYREQASSELTNSAGRISVEESESDKLIAKQFCFRNYEEVSPSELQDLGDLIKVLETELSKESEAGPSLNEDNLCPICYARPLEVQFEPCGHQSCRACITHYLMNRRDCFFCKSNVGTIVDIPPPDPAMEN